MRKSLHTQEKKVLPEPIEVYTETAIHPTTGEEYSYEVKVYAPEPSPTEGLNPAYAYGAG